MIDHAQRLARRHDTDFQIQMLMGVRPAAQRDLAREHDVAQFVPYGERWKRWVLNRGRRNVGLAARAVGGTVIPGIVCRDVLVHRRLQSIGRGDYIAANAITRTDYVECPTE